MKGFRDFILRGNVIDLAVAVIIGTAFTAIVTAFSEKLINPLLAAAGGVDASGLGFAIRPKDGVAPLDNPTFMDFGAVLTAAINFLIIAAIVYFVIVLPVNKLMEMRKKGQVEEVEATPEDVALLQEIRDLLKTGRSV